MSQRDLNVILLNGQCLEVQCDIKTKARDVFNTVVAYANLVEHFYFGLAYLKGNEKLSTVTSLFLSVFVVTLSWIPVRSLGRSRYKACAKVCFKLHCTDVKHICPGTVHQHSHMTFSGWHSQAEKAVSQPCTQIILSHAAPAEIPGSTALGKAACVFSLIQGEYRFSCVIYPAHTSLVPFCCQAELRHWERAQLVCRA